MLCGHVRPPRHVGHRHCDSCFSRRCKAPVEISVSCVLTPCHLLCGALFHMCKEEEHALLCPNEKVPCLNADFGCPMTMPRSWQASHLQVCPASVVCCSMEWNRWPAEDAQSHIHTVLQENLVKELGGGQAEALDLAMALRDQDHLFHSLKMKKLFPELVERVEEEEQAEARRRAEWRRRKEERKKREALEAQGAIGGVSLANGFPIDQGWCEPLRAKIQEAPREREEEEKQERELTQEERQALARVTVESDSQTGSRYWECMFNMEKGGCMISEAGQGTGSGVRDKRTESQQNQSKTNTETQTPTEANTRLDNVRHTHSDERPDPQCVACLAGPEKRQAYYYGQLEPVKIITVRTFKIPTSFTAKHKRIRNPSHWKRLHVAVDTSDLGVEPKDMPIWEEVQASLLCSLEKELRGHLIAESKSIDALLHDMGTQTYAFLSTPFGCNASLASVTEGRPLQLHLQLQAEGVTSRHNKTSSAFTFLCGHVFRRTEFPKHFRNVHADIQSCASGWFQQRCPLAYLGCTFSQKRFQPSTHTATVTYKRRRLRGGGGGVYEDVLSALPYEVLCYIAGFLDSLSLSQLALVSHLTRDVCSSLLHERGMVTLLWEKKVYKTGLAKWKAMKVVWEFSTVFTPVEAWRFDDNVPSMSQHLKVCPFYTIESRTERVLLLHGANNQVSAGTESKSNTLVASFQRRHLNA